MRIAILGGGSWGTALAQVFAGKDHTVSLLVRNPELAAEINRDRRNGHYLPEILLLPGITAGTEPERQLRQADIVVLAVPCQAMRQNLVAIRPALPAESLLVCVSKGLERGTYARMSQVVAEELPGHAERYAILSGPSFAKETAAGLPTAVVLGCRAPHVAALAREALAAPRFRVYSNPDVVGVECGGALKNVIALAAGIADGLGFGHNARAALITRGLAEMSRLGVALGASAATFMGLSGMGDLILTATGDLSRNRQVGLRLGRGEPLQKILASMTQVAEGIPTAQAAWDLGRKQGIDLPVTEAMHDLLAGLVTPEQAVGNLMSRALKDE